MAAPVTQKFEEMVLEISTDGGSTWSRICGIIDATVSRSNSIETTQLVDCADESLPMHVSKEVTALEVSVSGTGVWAQSSHETLMDWFYGGTTLQARIGNANASSGDTEYETGPAILSTLNNSRSKGNKVSAEIEVQFDGTPTRTAKP